VVDGVLSASFIETTRDAMYRTQEKIVREVGAQPSQAGERGVLRLMMKYDPHFFKFLEIPELLTVVDNTVSNTAIMHLQNGFILTTIAEEQNSDLFQNSFHQDFPRFLNGYCASINIMFAIDEFSAVTGATRFVPNTHQQAFPPEQHYLRENAVSVECPPGSMIVFDSTLWHASGINSSGRDRLAINHQFTRSYIKQQIDYVRALGDEIVLTQPPRTQQLLGWHTRVVTSLDEYYRPEHERLYRKGQG
jgi:ectoine hydroxylase-related dioxygenase (phytanoyl-CoA dioxygenase family)